MKKRIEWVDIFKGLAIIYILIGHTSSPINGFLYTFHVAAFFFISGYASLLDKSSFLSYFFRKFKRLIIPYFCVNTLFIALVGVFSYFKIDFLITKQPIAIASTGNYLINLIKSLTTADLGGATWFLIVLFETVIIAKFLNDFVVKIRNKRMKITALLLISFIFLLVGYRLYQSKTPCPFLLDLSFSALFYFILGSYSREYDLLNFLRNRSKMIYAVPISAFITVYFTKIHWAGMDWASDNFQPFL